MSRFDVTETITVDATKPSEAQRRILDAMGEGAELVGRFDVWGGYDWVLIRKQGFVSSVRRETVQGLLNRHLIVRGPSERVASGTQRGTFTLA